MAHTVDATCSKSSQEVMLHKQTATDKETGDAVNKSNFNSMHFTVAKNSKETLEIMNRLRTLHQLCDCVLVADGVKYHVHKVVMAAASPYFCAMFTGNMKEAEMKEITLHTVCPKTLDILINFAYTSELVLTDDNISFVLPAATVFQMVNVIEACCVFLEQKLNANNCIGIADFAKQYACMDLYTKASRFIQQNFIEVSYSSEFMELTKTQLSALIRQDAVMVKCESQIFDAVVRWVDYDQENRKNCMSSLLCSIRCQHLPPKFLNNALKQCRFLQECENSFKYLSNVFQEICVYDDTNDTGKRISYQPSCIFVVGGYLRQTLSNFECYCPKSQKWYKKPDLPSARSGVGCCILAGMFYVIGGRSNSAEGNRDCNEVSVFDPQDNTWKTRAPLSVPRHRVGVAAFKDFIYAAGGSYGTIHHASVEMYDPDYDKWTLVTSMSTPRIGACVVVCKCHMYAIGGYNGVNRLSTMEDYDFDSGQWVTKANMNLCRSGAGAATINNCIYVVGGYNNSSQLNSTEVYDPCTDQWTQLEPMNVARSALGVACLHEKLYALGGYDGTHLLSTVEMYDPEKNQWQEVTGMTCGRSGHGVATGLYMGQHCTGRYSDCV